MERPAPWGEVWNVEGTETTDWFSTAARVARGRANDATFYVGCHKGVRVTEVVVLFDMPDWERRMSTAQARSSGRDRATAVAFQRRVFALDDVYISRRSAGEAGRWIKSGWLDRLNDSGKLRLWQTPAAAFIDQLAGVEELAVLVTDDYGVNTSAVFDVRYLSAALDSDDVGWEC